MTKKLEAVNKRAQLHYRAAGNPITTLPSSAISNCFPGLDYDFKEFWRRAFEGIVLQEWDNYVIDAEGDYKDLKEHRLLKVDGRDVVVTVQGPQFPGGGPIPLPTTKPVGVVSLEWSNMLAFVMQKQGQQVECLFTAKKADSPVPVPTDTSGLRSVKPTVRKIFDGNTVAPAAELLNPGELTQSLCSPWQHDYRECSCYYWPAARPDYVNVEPTPDGVSRGDNWLAVERTGEYVLDDRMDTRLVTYIQLFTHWEAMLRFQIKGHDAEQA